jgi:hypothetical protein
LENVRLLQIAQELEQHATYNPFTELHRNDTILK